MNAPQEVDTATPTKTKARVGRPVRVAATIPSPVKRRGRPPKVDASPESAIKRRGRPPKKAQGSIKGDPRSKASKLDASNAKVTKKRGRVAKPKIKPVAAIVEKPKLELFGIEKIVGEYALECRAISAGWVDGYSYDMTISIAEPDEDGQVLAAFDLGFIDGTFLIVDSEEKLQASTTTNGQADGPVTPRTSPTPAPGDKCSREANGQDDNRRSRRVKTEGDTKPNGPAGARRVFLVWRGDSQVNGHRYVDDAAQTGWLDFPHATGASFWGAIDFPNSMGLGIAIQGTRLSKIPQDEALPWQHFETAPEAGDGNDDLDPLNTRGQAPTAPMLNGGGAQKNGNGMDDEDASA